jgi:hypothetical protein
MVSKPIGLTPSLFIDFYYIWHGKFHNSPKTTAKIWWSYLYTLIIYSYHLHTKHTHTLRDFLVLLCRLWTPMCLCVPWNACWIQVFIYCRSRAKNVKNGPKSEPLRSYWPFQNRKPNGVEKFDLPFLCVHTRQLVARFVTKQRRCELSTIAREGNDRIFRHCEGSFIPECTQREWELYIRNICTHSTSNMCRFFDRALSSSSTFLLLVWATA